MKKFLIITTAVLVITALVFSCLYIVFRINTTLYIDPDASTSYVLSLNDPVYAERFLKDSILMADSAVKGTVYAEEVPAEGEGLEYVLYTLRITNRSFADVRAVELSLNHENGDLLFYMPDENETVIEPGRTKDVSCLLLRRINNGQKSRDIKIDYLIFGKKYDQRFTVNEH